jgi:hypothetical protein
MAENFLGQIEEYDNNNESSFSPIDPTQHSVKNSYGKVIHTACLVANPRQNTPAVIMDADCQASEEIALTTNNFDSKANIPLGAYGIQNPINKQIQVLVLESSVKINAGTSQIEMLEDGAITITKGTTAITVGNNVEIAIQGTPVAQLTPSAVNFLVPVNMPAGSKVNSKLIAVVGGTTAGSAATQTINNSGQ